MIKFSFDLCSLFQIFWIKNLIIIVIVIVAQVKTRSTIASHSDNLHAHGDIQNSKEAHN